MKVTITAKEGNKIIEQHDVNLPKEAKYIGQDGDGEWWWYSIKPKLTASVKRFDSDRESGCFNITDENPDWRDTLIKVSDIK